MKNAVLVFASVVMLSACSHIKTKQIVDGIGQVTDVANAVCTIVDMFTSVNVEVPCAEQCAETIPKLNREEIRVMGEALRCAEKYPHEKPDFGSCLVDVAWKPVAEKFID